MPLAFTIGLLACGRTYVNGLEPPESESNQADAGEDGGLFVCENVEDCAPFSVGQPCPSLSGCGCGTFYTCDQSQCRSFSVDCLDGGDPGPVDVGGPLFPDAGTGRCMSAFDCQSGNRVENTCFGSEVRSCIDGHCVSECRPDSRTCFVVPGGPESLGCLQCDDGSRGCVNFCAAANVRVRYEVEASDCDRWPASGGEVVGSVLLSTDLAGPTCGAFFEHADTGFLLGDYFLLDTFEYFASFAELGGYCTGTMLPTGLERIYFGCPRCFIRLVRR